MSNAKYYLIISSIPRKTIITDNPPIAPNINDFEIPLEQVFPGTPPVKYFMLKLDCQKYCSGQGKL